MPTITRREMFKLGATALGLSAVYCLRTPVINYFKSEQEEKKEFERERSRALDKDADYDTLVKLSASKFYIIRLEVAERPYSKLPDYVQLRLSNDSNFEVLSALAARNDLIPQAAQNICNNLSTYAAPNPGIIIANIAAKSELTTQTFDKISALPDMSIYKESKQFIAKRKDAPQSALKNLTKSIIPGVAEEAKKSLEYYQISK